MAEQICIACGEQEAISEGMCQDCNAATYDMNPDLGFSYDDDLGFRSCNCEDYPCCGH